MSTAATSPPLDLRRLRYDAAMQHEIDCLAPRFASARFLHLLIAFHSRVPAMPRLIEDFRLGHIGLPDLAAALQPHHAEFVDLVRLVGERFEPCQD